MEVAHLRPQENKLVYLLVKRNATYLDRQVKVVLRGVDRLYVEALLTPQKRCYH